MQAKAAKLAERLRKAREVTVVSHIDADGLTAAAVATRALDRLGIPWKAEFLKSLKPEDATRLLDANPETLWFTDLGAGAADRFLPREDDTVISDHHVPVAAGALHLNPHFHGEDGARSLSGATATWLVARALAREAGRDAGIALVGAVGDLQDSDAGRLVGWNRVVLEDGLAAGGVETRTDVRYFGRETRPLYKLLQFADDPPVPGASGREAACCDLLANLGIDFKHAHPDAAGGGSAAPEARRGGNREGVSPLDSWRHWTHLTRDERSRVLTTVARSLLQKGYGHKAVRRLVGEVYVLPGEQPGTPVRDAKEFATLLNSTARYGEWQVGLDVARGDRGEQYERALVLLRGHRQNLVDGIKVAQDHGLVEREHLQWFHARDAVRETIVGIVAGMMYNKQGVRRDLPIIAFAHDGADKVKVSGRAHRALVEAGVNLADVMREAAASVGGAGGGHAPAAGATIPRGHEDEFLRAADSILARQMGR